MIPAPITEITHEQSFQLVKMKMDMQGKLPEKHMNYILSLVKLGMIKDNNISQLTKYCIQNCP